MTSPSDAAFIHDVIQEVVIQDYIIIVILTILVYDIGKPNRPHKPLVNNIAVVISIDKEVISITNDIVRPKWNAHNFRNAGEVLLGSYVSR